MFLERVPGAFIFIGQDGAYCHHPEYVFDPAVIPVGAALLVDLAISRTAEGGGESAMRRGFLDGRRRTLRRGLRMARAIGRQKALATYVAREMEPSDQQWSDAELDAHIARTALTVNHPAGTCKMGNRKDASSVVDAACRVIGAEALRVVDASVMPDLVGGNINARVIMIAE